MYDSAYSTPSLRQSATVSTVPRRAEVCTIAPGGIRTLQVQTDVDFQDRCLYQFGYGRKRFTKATDTAVAFNLYWSELLLPCSLAKIQGRISP